MKFILAALSLVLSMQAHATGGLECRDIEGGSLGISTDEASVGGDNVLSMTLYSGVKETRLNFVAVSRGDYPQTVYMGSDKKGNSVALILNVAKKEGKDVSKALVKLKDRTIYQEMVYCSAE